MSARDNSICVNALRGGSGKNLPPREERAYLPRNLIAPERFAPVRMYRPERAKRCGYFVVSRETGVRLLLAALVALLSGCGYRPVATAGAELKMCVRAANTSVAYPRAVEAALNGARRELASHGALVNAASGQCLVIALLRVDEAPIGVSSNTSAMASAMARGTAVSVLGRAWVEQTPGAAPQSDSGDVRRSVHVETTSGIADALRHEQAVTAAAEEVGTALARAALGLPIAGDTLP